MNQLASIRPNKKPRIIDIVEAAGIDVSDWAVRPSGAHASTNPKYCYNWCFTETGKISVAALWFDNMKIDSENIFYEIDFEKYGSSSDGTQGVLWRKRASELEAAIAQSFGARSPMKVIISDRLRPLLPEGTKIASKTISRSLDSHLWDVEFYDQKRRACRLVRRARA